MASIVNINENHLMATVIAMEPHTAFREGERTYYLSIAVLKHFLSVAWVDKHLDPDGPPGFLRQIPGDPDNPETNTQMFKLVDLAECFFNLQHVDGFAECVERMRNGDLEGTHAELDLGRMLHMHRVKFRFVIPTGVKGDDYDIEIECDDGLRICADAKCKLTSTEYSIASIENTLNSARSQFPPDKPGAIFLKIPARWFSDDQRWLDIQQAAWKFLKGTGRIISVKFYIPQIRHEDGMITHTQVFKELSKTENKFCPGRDWDLFGKTSQGDPVPPTWKRLMTFAEPHAIREAYVKNHVL